MQIESIGALTFVNKGAIAEQVAGQLLRTVFSLTQDPQLYYWVRLHQEKCASAQVGYIIAHRTLPILIEIKAGATGSLKSLHAYMALKKLSKAVRICSAIHNISQAEYRGSENATVRYELRSLPFYLLGEIHRLLD